MRHLSFAMTTEQIRNRTKTCTRRMRWLFAKAGDVVQPVVKGQGLKKGEHVERIGGPIRFTKVTREFLYGVWRDGECAREGFPGMGPAEFVVMFCKVNKCQPGTCVTRIEFEYLEEKP